MAFNILFPKQIFTNASMGADATSLVVPVAYQDNIGFQLDWTGAPVGDFEFQISIDHLQDAQGVVTHEGNWITVPVTPTITAAGVADQAFVDLNQMSATYVRVVYSRTSGTGTLNGFAVAKGI